MKQLLLLLLCVVTTVVFAQKISRQTISFKYEQKPLIAIDRAATYDLELNLTKYNNKNNDSIIRTEYLLNQFEKNSKEWYLKKIKIDQDFQLKNADWERHRIANPNLIQPIKEVYPPQPIKEEINLPVLLNSINKEVVTEEIKLDGFVKGNGGMKVIYEPEGLENVKEESRKTETATEYYLKYTSPYNVYLMTQSGRTILSKTGGKNLITYKIGVFENESAYEQWKVNNYAPMWKKVQEDATTRNIKEANQLINSEIGYPEKSVYLDVYTVRKFKKMDYSDFVSAYVLAKEGYYSIRNETSSTIKSKLKKAIDVWESAERESDVNYKKARINKKITAVVYLNLVNAYLWSDDFNKADFYIQKTISLGVSKYKNIAKRTQSIVDNRRERFEANN